MSIKMNGLDRRDSCALEAEAQAMLGGQTTAPAAPGGRRLTDYYASMPITDETACGIGCFRGPLLQKLANKKAFVILYGILGCIFSACYSYLNGTITTIEKRFRISSKTTGIIMVGNDISVLFITILLSYYAGRGHRPRWVAMGIYTVVVFCLMNALPHLLYGPGEDALLLTKEYGSKSNMSVSVFEKENRRTLCQSEAGDVDCSNGSMAPAVILFIAQLISGVGGSLYFTLGVSYMDDNIKKSKTPALISFSYFLRMLGPAIGYSLASFCLKIYVSPSLHPTITTSDPRWLGAWWLGWLVLAAMLFVAASFLALFPKTLPRAAARRALALDRLKNGEPGGDVKIESEMPTSFKDLIVTFKRVMRNKTLTCNNLASIFYFMGYTPYWIFLPKYIETMYKQSASFASLITGTVGLVFSAIGILVSGVVITRLKPSARCMAAWNVLVGVISILGITSYVFLGCPANDNHLDILANGELELAMPCNADCHCDYVKYSPVCAPNHRTYISPCHAGCRDKTRLKNDTKMYTNCSCVPLHQEDNFMLTSSYGNYSSAKPESASMFGSVVAGPCPIDCSTQFYMFLAVCCIIKFSSATGRVSNFLVSVRCVDEKDKPVAIAIGMTLVSLFSFIPSPILYGYLIDRTCLIWGKTCTGTGNCWLYNGESLRYILNVTSAVFVTIGTIFDGGVWFYVKDLKVFDNDEEEATKSEKEKSSKM
ncbi:solute carrier organic anion transporter family member 74D [Nilaparvata lugens]|uniref:solute carrier organic anion transporter family member 74D n=1 Tax=Nilaparvata lugens TaxID=108931 RepID=UPI00193D34CC|nr:solute carrier organic anion transporter family member 74D [Nilaparvata lugens]